MSESVKMVAQKREKLGSRHSRKLREQGRLPGVVYGHKEASVAITVSADDFHKAIRHGARLVNLETDGVAETALIRDVQWDYLGIDILHVDFTRVSAEERITVDVPVEFKGTAIGVTQGGTQDQPMASVSVECAAMSVPDAIVVNISELKIGEAIHVRDLVAPPGVKLLDDPDDIVVHILEPRTGEEEEETGTAEPEVISRERDEEEGEEE